MEAYEGLSGCDSDASPSTSPSATRLMDFQTHYYPAWATRSSRPPSSRETRSTTRARTARRTTLGGKRTRLLRAHGRPDRQRRRAGGNRSSGAGRCARAGGARESPTRATRGRRLRGGVRDPGTGWLDFEQVCELTAEVRERVAAALRRGACRSSWAAAAPSSRARWRAPATRSGECGIAYLDGHFDLYEGDTSQTGEAADFPLAAAIGRAPRRRCWTMAGGDAVVDPRGDRAARPARREKEAVGFAPPRTCRGRPISHLPDRSPLARAPTSRHRRRRRPPSAWLRVPALLLTAPRRAATRMAPATDVLAMPGRPQRRASLTPS